MVRKKVSNNSPVFLSKSQRPDYFVLEHTANTVGPGSYASVIGGSNSLMRSSHERLIVPRSSMHYTYNPLDVEKGDSRSERNELGPGCYKIESGFDS